MQKNRSVPTDTLLPHIMYRNLPAAMAWLTATLGFKEHYRYGDPDSPSGSQMLFGNACIMLRSAPDHPNPAELGFGTQYLTIFVEPIDAHFAHTQSAGAKILEDLHETVYGERQYAVQDLEGHQWLFSHHVRDLSPEDWGGIPAPR